MKKRRHGQPDAKYELFEEGKHWFKCLRCSGDWLYEPWEIRKHILESHKIPIRQQVILGWSKEFQKDYLKNKDKPLTYRRELNVDVDLTASETYEREKERMEKERKAARDR